jgi:hypothetical protein
MEIFCRFEHKNPIYFDSIRKYINHYKRFHSITPLRCFVKGCGMIFISSNAFVSHIYLIHPELLKFACNVKGCLFRTESKKFLEEFYVFIFFIS